MYFAQLFTQEGTGTMTHSKLFTRLCAALLLSSTLFALAGCNQQEDAKDEPEDTTSQTEAKEQEVSTQEETQEPAGPTAEEILEG